MLRYHAGWNFALNRQVGDELFHPTTLVNFRQRLLEHDLSAIGFQAVLDALIGAGLAARKSRQRLKHRNAIEGTQSELVRAHGLRRARYRGLVKTKLQNYFAGAACNVKRWLRRLIWETRRSLAAKAASAAPVAN